MKQNVIQFMFTVCLFVGLIVLPARADLGLKQVLAANGSTAVGQTVRTAVSAVYASTKDSQLIQDQIVAIINEAVATGDGEAVRYTLIAVMMAGGGDHLDLSKMAIDNSTAFTRFPDITAVTVTDASSLISAMGGISKVGGGAKNELGGGAKGLGGGAKGLGGGAKGLSGDAKKGLGGGAKGLGGGAKDLGGGARGLGGGAKDLGGGESDNPLDDGGEAVIDDNDVVPTRT